MKELAGRHSVGNSYEIEVLDNGFLLTRDYPRRKEAYSTFSDLVTGIARAMHLVEIGEALEIRDRDSAPQWERMFEEMRVKESMLLDEVKELKKGILRDPS